MSNRKGRVKNWQEIDFMGAKRIYGNVYDCEAFGQGHAFFTSRIVKYHTFMGQMVVETESGSMYHLENPAETDLTIEEIVKKAMSNEKEETLNN